MIKEVIYSKRMLIRDLENNDFNFIIVFTMIIVFINMLLVHPWK